MISGYTASCVLINVQCFRVINTKITTPIFQHRYYQNPPLGITVSCFHSDPIRKTYVRMMWSNAALLTSASLSKWIFSTGVPLSNFHVHFLPPSSLLHAESIWVDPISGLYDLQMFEPNLPFISNVFVFHCWLLSVFCFHKTEKVTAWSVCFW